MVEPMSESTSFAQSEPSGNHRVCERDHLNPPYLTVVIRHMSQEVRRQFAYRARRLQLLLQSHHRAASKLKPSRRDLSLPAREFLEPRGKGQHADDVFGHSKLVCARLPLMLAVVKQRNIDELQITMENYAQPHQPVRAQALGKQAHFAQYR